MRKILLVCEHNSVQIIVILMCIPALFSIRDVNSYHLFFYFIDYSTGFGGKKLLGELCSIWLPMEVGQQHLLPLIALVDILMILLFAWFCGKCLSQNLQSKRPMLVFIIIYLLSPFTFILLINMSSRVDFYLATATLGFLYFFIRHRGTWYYYLLTLVILCLACLIHHIFCIIFFPLIFAIFIYDVFSDNKNAKKNIILYSVITLLLFILFCSIVLFSIMNTDFETLYSSLQERSTASTSALSQKNALYYEFYAKLPEHYIAYVQPVWKYNIARFVLTIVLLFPLLLLFWIPWILAIRHSINQYERWCYIIMQISVHLLILPAYMMAIDYDRWNCAYCFIQFCMTLLLYYYSKTFSKQVDKVINVLRKQYIIVLLIVVYISSLELPMGNSSLAVVDKVCNKFGLFWRVNEILP